MLPDLTFQQNEDLDVKT